ncbi:uncharacterized protein ycf36 [Phtheirospermum japonicum]|uniref:Uncharacterized protein ycf36 n=1 Tax=Phtheirospermum japonicum TaxID=374723 RepID=A0A830B0Z8_9LAMI|nr:uncharacterized protein ycf36 [Phtheirospermum japonicum]
MGVVIESEIWEPSKALFIVLFISCVFSILFLPTKSIANVVDHAPAATFIRFQRKFLILYSLASVMEGLWAVFGEYELAYFGFSKEEMLTYLSIGYAVSMLIGSVLGVLSDLLGHKKLCQLFYTLHLFVTVWKIVIGTPTIWLISISLSMASSIFSLSFETWMVVEHDKLGQRQDSLNDMFWLMTFFESASFIGSQSVANYLTDSNVNKNIKSTWNMAVVLAVVGIIYVTRGSKEDPQIETFKDYRVSLRRHAISDKRIWLLSWAQGCVHFSVSAFWILWAPTIVADGREVLLGLIYPCLLGSKMLGSTVFPWFFHGRLALRIEEYLLYAFVIMGLALSVVAYDYQRGYYQLIGNSTIISFAALGLFSAAGCISSNLKEGKSIHGGRSIVLITFELLVGCQRNWSLKDEMNGGGKGGAPGQSWDPGLEVEKQKQVNEYSSLKDETLYSWAGLSPGSFFLRLGGLWLVTFTVLGVPIAAASFSPSKDPLRFGLAAGIGTLFLVSLIVLRIYLGWSYVGDRLLSAVVPYEESGWYDGQMWVKPPEILARDRLLGSYKVKPVIKLLKQTLVGTGAVLVAAVSLFVFATPVEDFFHKTKDELLRLPADVVSDDDLAAAAAEAADGRPVYCRDRFYRALAGGQYCKWEDLLK